MKPYDLARLANEIMSSKPLTEAKTDQGYSPANDYEGEMAISQLKAMMEKAQAVLSMLKPESKLEAWVQSKITLADDYLSSVSDYLKHTDGAIGESVEVSEGVRMMAGVEKMLKNEGHPTMVNSLRNIKKSLEGKPTGSVMVITKEKSPESMEIKIYEPSDFASMTKGLTKKAEAKVGSKGSWSGGEVTVIAIKESVEVTEAPMIAPPDVTMRGYSPSQFENKFRELMGRLGFSKSMPIKKFGTSFWVSFENMPKARDFSMTLENMMRRNLKPGVKLTKILSVEADDPSIAKGIVPKTTRAIVVVNLGNVMQEAFESYGFAADDFFKTNL